MDTMRAGKIILFRREMTVLGTKVAVMKVK